MKQDTTKTDVLFSLNELANNPENKFVVVAIDETKYWHEDIQREAKQIDGVYLVDLTQPTHLCELAISFPATFLYNFFHDTMSEDSYSWECFNGEDCYLKGSNRYHPRKIYGSEYTLEEIVDYEAGNPTVC